MNVRRNDTVIDLSMAMGMLRRAGADDAVFLAIHDRYGTVTWQRNMTGKALGAILRALTALDDGTNL